MSEADFVTAILLAAGRGSRAGSELPKQFLELAGRPMLLHPIETLRASARVSALVIVLPEERPPAIDEALDLPEVASITAGGPERQSSLGEGMVCIPDETSIVLVHDAARPLLRPELIDRVLDALDGAHHGAICAVAVDDAIKEVSADSEILAAKARNGLWRAQTPQAFLRESLEDALARTEADGVSCEDCSEMLTRAGYRVKVVEGDPWNLKVTLPKDLSLAEYILRARKEAGLLGEEGRR